jgi:hypothetical protein
VGTLSGVVQPDLRRLYFINSAPIFYFEAMVFDAIACCEKKAALAGARECGLFALRSFQLNLAVLG